MPATQFNMKWVEPAGLVKFDFLGLKTLTTLRKAQNLLARRGIEVELGKIPLDDAKTYEMLGRGETVGVFQVESAGMRKALVEMRADRFEDLIALVALYRPGPMANIPTYCARKLGHEKPDYIHPKIEPILRETFGVIIYQEQVMQIARELSGYSLGEADMLRRAMGKKIKSEMDAQRARFVNGAQERGLTKALADEIFDLLARFADYGFNKSHAAAYALIAYWTAWFKANHPAEFLAASMTLDKSNTDKLAEFRAEAQRLGIRVAPPSINGSNVDFDVREHAAGRAGDRLCAERDQGRRRRPGGGAGRSARRRGRSLRSPIWRGGSTRAPSTRRRSRTSPPPAPSTNWSPTAPSPSPRSSRCWRSPIAPPTSARPARAACSAKPRPRRRSGRAPKRGRPPNGCGANTRRSASSSPAIRSKPTTRR